MKIDLAPALLIMALVACKGREAATPAPGGGSSTGSAVVSDADKLAKANADADAKAAKEKTRWTPALTAAVVALRDQQAKDTGAALAAIVAGPQREPGNSDRDGARHPVDTLTFFGIEPTQTVVELGGGGWYTEILAPLLADRGKLIVVAPDANAPAGKLATAYGHAVDLFLGKSPELYGKVQRLGIVSADSLSFGAPASADLLIAMREMHNWQRSGELAKYLAAIHAVLKPGGTFGVEQHRAALGTRGEDTAEKGYLAEQWVIDRVTAAGFELVAKSEINANPKDTKDYPKGVWNLPPVYRDGETDRAKYAAIGESDRMTLKFKRL